MTNKIWITKKLITIYSTYKGDPTNPKSLKCDTHNSTVVGRHYEVENIAQYGDYVFIQVLHNNQYWYTWVNAESLKPAPVRYMIRPSRNPHKWEVWNTVWHQKAMGEYDFQAIAQAHATNLNIAFKVGKIGAAWFSIRDGSWTIELIPVDCLPLLRKNPDVDMHLRVSKHGEYSPLTLTQEESLALNNGVCLTFHPHRDPYEVRIALFKIMRKRYGIEPFTYNCNNLTRHQFYQAINSNSIVEIDEEWYNTYLDMQEPTHWICMVKWYEKNGIMERQIDFITAIGDERIAFWFDGGTNQYYCRKLVNCQVTF